MMMSMMMMMMVMTTAATIVMMMMMMTTTALLAWERAKVGMISAVMVRWFSSVIGTPLHTGTRCTEAGGGAVASPSLLRRTVTTHAVGLLLFEVKILGHQRIALAAGGLDLSAQVAITSLELGLSGAVLLSRQSLLVRQPADLAAKGFEILTRVVAIGVPALLLLAQALEARLKLAGVVALSGNLSSLSL